MSHTASAPAAVRPARALESEARRAGYVPGFPPALRPSARHADLSAYRRAKCPACRSRMAALPYHRPAAPGGYRVVLACHVCGAGEVA